MKEAVLFVYRNMTDVGANDLLIADFLMFKKIRDFLLSMLGKGISEVSKGIMES